MSLGLRERIDVVDSQRSMPYSRVDPEILEEVRGTRPRREVYASSEMVDQTSLLREFPGPFADAPSDAAGFEDCESFFTYL